MPSLRHLVRLAGLRRLRHAAPLMVAPAATGGTHIAHTNAVAEAHKISILALRINQGYPPLCYLHQWVAAAGSHTNRQVSSGSTVWTASASSSSSSSSSSASSASATAAAAAAAAALLAIPSLTTAAAAEPQVRGKAPEQAASSPPPPPQQQQQPLTNHPLELDPVTNEHTALMTMARNAALEYYQAGKYAKAEAKFLEALREAVAGFDAKDPHIASAKNNLAEFYRNTKQYAKAELLYKEALDQLEAIFGQKHWLYVSTLHNLALMNEAEGRYQQALEQMKQVLDLRLKMFGPRSFLYADSMFALANITLKLGGKGSDQQAVQLMNDAISILEDAESVQVNVVLVWLGELAAQLRRQSRAAEAAACFVKALKYMQDDKGAVMAEASALSESLVECLLEVQPPGCRAREARDVMERCVSARVLLFKRELAVVTAMQKLAAIEGQLGQDSALQHASNAATLSRELLQELSKGAAAGWTSWMKPRGAAAAKQGVKCVQAGHLLGTSLKLLASLHLQLPGGRKSEAEPALHEAVQVLKEASQQAHAQLQLGQATGDDTRSVDELSWLYMETMLQCMECLDKLVELAAGRGDKEGAHQLQQQSEAVASQLVALV